MAAIEDENVLDYGWYHARVDGSGVLVFLPSFDVAPAEGMKDLKGRECEVGKHDKHELKHHNHGYWTI